MSNEKFTQGEWAVEENAYGEFTVSSDGEEIAFPIEGYTNINRKANAHLISAAPDMYRALRDVLPECEQQQDGYYTANLTQYEVEAIRAALAKADVEQ